MIDSRKLKEAIWNDYRRCENIAKMAKDANISYAYLHDLLHGKRDFDGLTIKKINSLFPDCILHLFGDNVKIDAPQNSGNVVGVNHGTVGGCLDWAMDKILAADELSADEKIKVLKVLKK